MYLCRELTALQWLAGEGRGRRHSGPGSTGQAAHFEYNLRLRSGFFIPKALLLARIAYKLRDVARVTCSFRTDLVRSKH